MQFLSTPPSPNKPDESSKEPDSNSVPMLLSNTSLNILPPPKLPNIKLPATEEERDETLLKSFAIALLARRESFKSNELTSLSTIESTVEALQLEPDSNALVLGGKEDSKELVAEVQLLVVAMVVIVEEELETELFNMLGAKSSRVAIYKTS